MKFHHQFLLKFIFVSLLYSLQLISIKRIFPNKSYINNWPKLFFRSRNKLLFSSSSSFFFFSPFFSLLLLLSSSSLLFSLFFFDTFHHDFQSSEVIWTRKYISSIYIRIRGREREREWIFIILLLWIPINMNYLSY